MQNFMKINRMMIGLLAMGMLGATLQAADKSTLDTPDTTWFQDAGFGVFLHWGVYAQKEGQWKGMEREKDLWAEWIRNRAGISQADYEELARSFAPDDFNADAWADVFKTAGAR